MIVTVGLNKYLSFVYHSINRPNYFTYLLIGSLLIQINNYQVRQNTQTNTTLETY